MRSTHTYLYIITNKDDLCTIGMYKDENTMPRCYSFVKMYIASFVYLQDLQFRYFSL